MAINQEAKGVPNGLSGRGFGVPDIAKEIKSLMEKDRNARGKRRKRVKTPTRLERTTKLRDRLANLVEELESAGFARFLPPPGPVTLVGPEIKDPKTQGIIGHAQEPLGAYIQRVSVQDNFFQRQPFDHVSDPIYRRLIRDFIDGAVMPETKIAALSSVGNRLHCLHEEDIKFSIIDGLQRLYCFLIAVLLVWQREQLVQDGYVPPAAWDFFIEPVNKCGEPRAATEMVLQRLVRFEIFYGINLAGLLNYMVTFNTGQRRMSLRMQLEIMKKPLIAHFKRDGIPIWEDSQRMPSEQRPKEKFPASDLVLATQAFITNTAHVTASAEAERFLDENEPYLDNIGDISDVMKTLKRITAEVHPKLMQVYDGDTTKSQLFLGGDSFLLGLTAACGYVRNRGNMAILDKALDRLMDQLNRPAEDPINLKSYENALSMMTHTRGKAARRMVDDTFRRFFLGVTTELEWLDTARQITAGVV